MIHAARELTPGFAGFWDADLATPLEAIPGFIETMEANSRLQLVMGARVRLMGRRIKRKASRHYLGRVFATTVSLTLQLPVYDTQCGAKLFRVNDGLAGLFRDAFVSRWIFDVEILARMIQASGGDRAAVAEGIYELPLSEWEDIDGSKLRSKDFVAALRDIFRIRQKYLAGGRGSGTP